MCLNKISPMKKFNSRLLLVLLFAICIPSFSCQRRLAGAAASEDKVEKMQEQRKAEEDEAYKLALKHVMAIQTKDTRKRMKQSRKRSERLMAGKPEKTFFQRLFTPKVKKVKAKPNKN